MAKRTISLFKFLMVGLLALLGFTSCSKKNNEEVVSMYGSPYAKITIKATVVNDQNTPLGNARIRVRTVLPGIHYTPSYYEDPVGEIYSIRQKTNNLGIIDTTETIFSYPKSGETFLVYRESDNPSLNGVFSDDSVHVEPVQLEPANGWYNGACKVEGTLKLKKKKTSN